MLVKLPGGARVTPHAGTPSTTWWDTVTANRVHTAGPRVHGGPTLLSNQRHTKSSAGKCQKAKLAFATSGALPAPVAASAVRLQPLQPACSNQRTVFYGRREHGGVSLSVGFLEPVPCGHQGNCTHFYSNSHGDARFLSKAQAITGDIIKK